MSRTSQSARRPRIALLTALLTAAMALLVSTPSTSSASQELRLVVYYDAVFALGQAAPPAPGSIVDLGAAPQPREHPTLTVNRAWQQLFAKRYAGSHRMHTFVQFASHDSSGASTDQSRAQDAALVLGRIRPFAVVDQTGPGSAARSYLEQLASHGVVTMQVGRGLSARSYPRFPARLWGLEPPMERSAELYADAACSVLVGRPADSMGPGTRGSAQNGRPRRFGLIVADVDLGTTATMVRDRTRSRCGLTVASEQRLRSGASTVAEALQAAGVTTVLWPSGGDPDLASAMAALAYFPEILLGGDRALRTQATSPPPDDQAVWEQAWMVTDEVDLPAATADRLCVKEYRSVDQQTTDKDVTSYACDAYPLLRQLYVGIRAAGAQVTPGTFSHGLHVLPRRSSSDPQLPACFYELGDYTCVKDAVLLHWDARALPDTSAPLGCWRQVLGGKRFPAWGFPQLGLSQLAGPGDHCTSTPTRLAV